MENGCINHGLSASQLAVNENSLENSDITNGELFSLNSDISINSTSSTVTNQKRTVRNGIGASTNLENPYRNSMYIEEGRIMSLQLPTGKKGFIGDIGFSFGGEEHDETMDPSEWKLAPILVESVTRGSIAEKAGLEPGDEIIKINAVTVEKADRSLPVSLIRNCDKKMRIIVRKGMGAKRAENMVFSREQTQEFCDAFSLYDHSNKRKILVKDVPRVCRLLGYNETSLAYDDAISTARTKTGEAADGEKVRWDTFLEILKEILKHQEVEKDALSAYAVFDPGRKGEFSIRQLRDAFVMNCRATPLEMAEIFRMADPDLDGKVNEKEFLKLLYPFVEMY